MEALGLGLWDRHVHGERLAQKKWQANLTLNPNPKTLNSSTVVARPRVCRCGPHPSPLPPDLPSNQAQTTRPACACTAQCSCAQAAWTNWPPGVGSWPIRSTPRWAHLFLQTSCPRLRIVVATPNQPTPSETPAPAPEAPASGQNQTTREMSCWALRNMHLPTPPAHQWPTKSAPRRPRISSQTNQPHAARASVANQTSPTPPAHQWPHKPAPRRLPPTPLGAPVCADQLCVTVAAAPPKPTHPPAPWRPAPRPKTKPPVRMDSPRGCRVRRSAARGASRRAAEQRASASPPRAPSSSRWLRSSSRTLC
eukprot:364233-Chlamydomonas_euryale.AAC.3